MKYVIILINNSLLFDYFSFGSFLFVIKLFIDKFCKMWYDVYIIKKGDEMMIWFEMSYNKLDKLFSFEIEDEEEVYIEEEDD